MIKVTDKLGWGIEVVKGRHFRNGLRYFFQFIKGNLRISTSDV